MAIRGRPPKPTAIKIIEGNRGHRPILSGATDFATGLPEKPPFISEHASHVWDQLVAQLAPGRILRVVDGQSLWQLCEDEALVVEMYRSLRKLLTNVERNALEKAEKEKKNVEDILPGGPLWALLSGPQNRMAMSQFNTICTRMFVQRREFGLTPSASLRVGTNQLATEDIDPLMARLCG